MAERLLKHALEAQGAPLNQLVVNSFGLHAAPGLTASENAVFALSKVGIDLSDHQSKAVDQIDFSRLAEFFCMTEAHRDALLRWFEVDPSRTHLFGSFTADAQAVEIPDPFGCGVQVYESCRDAMVELIPGLLEFLRNRD